MLLLDLWVRVELDGIRVGKAEVRRIQNDDTESLHLFDCMHTPLTRPDARVTELNMRAARCQDDAKQRRSHSKTSEMTIKCPIIL